MKPLKVVHLIYVIEWLDYTLAMNLLRHLVEVENDIYILNGRETGSH